MIFDGMRQVFSRGSYIGLAIVIGIAVFVLTTWLPNLGLVGQIALSDYIPLSEKAKILTSLVGSITTNFTVFSALLTIAIAILFGANAAMSLYYLRTRSRLSGHFEGSATATSVGGLVSGLFGVGCAACGAFVLSPVLTFLGLSGMIAFLPFGGEEFGALGALMLGVSAALTARQIGSGNACPIEVDVCEVPAKQG